MISRYPQNGFVSSDTNAFLAAARWVEGVLSGPLATSLAVIAIASLGFLLLSGRVDVKRGAVVILGCFVLFGASAIAHGLRDLAASAEFQRPPLRATVAIVPVEPNAVVRGEPVDPYAGASVRR